MKRLIFTIVLMVLSTRVMAFDFLGPPSAYLGKGQSGLGIEYLKSEITLDAEGVFVLADTEIEDIEFNKIYSVLRGGLSPEAEMFVRLGIADAEVDQGANMDNLGYYIGESDSGFAVGGGAKITLLETEAIKWGLVGQISYLDMDFDGATGTFLGWPVSLDAEVKILEFEVGIGPTIEISKGACLYGGALFHFIDGEADITGTVGPLSETQTSDLKEDSVFGGFVGGQLKIADTSDLAIEFQTTGDSYAFGISLMHRFGERTKVAERQTVPKINVPDTGQKIRGYRGSIDPLTGKPVLKPLYYEDEKE